MAIERTYYCEATDCEAHARTATPPPHLPASFYEVRSRDHGEDSVHHFCSWPCVAKFAAEQPWPERIEDPNAR